MKVHLGLQLNDVLDVFATAISYLQNPSQNPITLRIQVRCVKTQQCKHMLHSSTSCLLYTSLTRCTRRKRGTVIPEIIEQCRMLRQDCEANSGDMTLIIFLGGTAML